MSKKAVKLDPHNTRKHGEKNKALINKSLKELGAGRSVLVDSEGFLIAGNGVYEQAEKEGITTRVIESDGSELIVVKRTDLKYNDEKRRNLAIADNATSDTSEMDFQELTQEEVIEWGIEYVEEHEQEDEENYSRKIETPSYDPSEKKPDLNELLDLSKYNTLLSKINESEIPEEVAGFLKQAAKRHIVYDYEKIADFYAHSEKEIQELMEESALVIIDFNKAIDLGYVKLTKKIAKHYITEHGNDEL